MVLTAITGTSWTRVRVLSPSIKVDGSVLVSTIATALTTQEIEAEPTSRSAS